MNRDERDSVTVQIDPIMAEMIESVRLDWRLESLDEAVDQMLMLAIAATRSMSPVGGVR